MVAKTGRQKKKADFIIRPARLEDKETVLAFTKNTFGENGDYIAKVWDDWLADQEGPFWVAEASGRAVGIAKLTFHSQEEAWMEGLRVDPNYRGKGVARALHQKCVEKAKARGVRVVRFATHSANRPIHRLAKEFRFRKVSAFAYYVADPQVSEARTPLTVSPDLFPVVRDFIKTSRFYQVGKGFLALLSIRWVWKELNEERLQGHINRGEVKAYFGPGGAIEALAIVGDVSEESLWIGYLDGKPAAVQELALALRSKEAEGMFPAPTPLLDVLEEAGYEQGFDLQMWIFEKRLKRGG